MPDSRVDNSKCSGCGSCILACPSLVIRKHPDTGKAAFTEDFEEFCLRCGHCMAICPEEAVFVGGMTYEKDFAPFSATPADAAAFGALLETRRAIRNFTDEPVAKEHLDEIVRLVALAPMGFPPSAVELTVVNGREKIEKALPLMTEFYKKLSRYMANPIIRLFMKLGMSRSDFVTVSEKVVPLMRRAVPKLEAGCDLITRGAPAMMLIHADKASRCLLDDGHIAQVYVFLAAHALGLGASVVGLVPPAVQMMAELREMFGIPRSNKITGCVIIGHPKTRYSRRAMRRSLKALRWI